jgi:hypothetical protein
MFFGSKMRWEKLILLCGERPSKHTVSMLSEKAIVAGGQTVVPHVHAPPSLGAMTDVIGLRQRAVNTPRPAL